MNHERPADAAWHRMMKRAAAEQVSLELPELDDLELPPFLPGRRPESARELLYAGDGISLTKGPPTVFYDPDGAPIDGEFLEAARRVHAYQEIPGAHLVARPFFRAGVRIRVSTAYLGHDLGTGVLPMPWETRVFAGGWSGSVCYWRYTTRAAAHNGHHAVVGRIRDAQRARRLAARTTAPRGRPAPCDRLQGMPPAKFRAGLARLERAVSDL
jgi:hypothetical protein